MACDRSEVGLVENEERDIEARAREQVAWR